MIQKPRGSLFRETITGGEQSLCGEGAIRYFDAVSPNYFDRYHEESPGGHALRVRQQRVLELLDTPIRKVLDVGCGPGVMVSELLNRGCKVWGIDASSGMIQQSRNQFRTSSRAHFVVADAGKLPFPDAFFDAVICMGVIGNIRTGAAAIQEMARVTKKMGTIVISLPNFVSPYVIWKTFVFYPAMIIIRPLYYRLARRAQPPSLYGLSWCRQSHSLLTSLTSLHSARGVRNRMERYGLRVANMNYFNFNIFLSPLDELLPVLGVEIASRLEALRSTKLKWLATGFVVKARKIS